MIGWRSAAGTAGTCALRYGRHVDDPAALGNEARNLLTAKGPLAFADPSGPDRRTGPDEVVT